MRDQIDAALTLYEGMNEAGRKHWRERAVPSIRPASGLTFYDDEVISFFGPRAHGMEVMFLMLLGRRMSPTFRM